MPEGFAYPPVGSHDACSMLTWSTFPLTTCQQIRINNRTLIRIQPPPEYTNGPVIIKIVNTNHSNWFRAPPLPGNWYNYTVSLYSPNGSLLERQSSDNITMIGGLDLNRTSMSIENGRDALQL